MILHTSVLVAWCWGAGLAALRTVLANGGPWSSIVAPMPPAGTVDPRVGPTTVGASVRVPARVGGLLAPAIVVAMAALR